MKSRLTLRSTFLLLALMLSFVPSFELTSSHASAWSVCDWAQFIADVTIPDGTSIAPGATFTKTWRLKNIGTCTWTTSYALVFSAGDPIGAPQPATVNFPSSVAPGQTVDLSVNLTAPKTAGHYIGFWKLRNASGVLFGIGSTADKSFWVEINVSSTSGVAYDFSANACSAIWSSGQGTLPCPGTDGSASGFVLKVTNPQLENGSFGGGLGLVVQPQNVFNGFIQGVYPAFRVQNGDRFQSIVNCTFGAASCFVTFRLDYQIGNGPINTFWSFREKYDGLYYHADIDLSPLAGQDVKFILTVLAAGSASGDRALWANPIIARTGTTPPPTTGTMTPTPPVPAACNRAQFVADVTIPDGTLINPGATFTKTWRLKNVGTCTWTTAYALMFDSGYQMGGPSSVALPRSVVPGTTVDLTISLVAPSVGGSYRGYWKFRDNNGVPFGIGSDGTKSWWVDIKVSGPTATPSTSTPSTVMPSTTPSTPGTPPTPGAGTMYDFAANACSAAWFSSSGSLPCPGIDGDPRGFVLKVTNPQLENGAIDPRLGLITYPQSIYNGYIQGIYPSYRVKTGDRFRSIVNCAYGATSCLVVFRLDYQTGTGPIQTYWAFVEKYDGLFGQADLDLSPLVGLDVKFILTVLSAGSPTGDRALWVAPIIYNASFAGIPSPVVPSATPTPSGTPVTATQQSSNTLTYVNQKYGFQFNYPSQGQISNQTDNTAHITLPIAPGTNLREKYLDVSVADNVTTCTSPLTNGYAPGGFQSQQVSINGINFVKESGSQGAAGNFYDWVAYSVLKGTSCISLSFVLHSLNPGNFATPPPTFNMITESSVFSDIVSSFVFTSPSGPTATLIPTVAPPTATPSSAAVSISNFAFLPQSLQIKAGTTVIWTNNDTVAHTITSDSGAFDSGSVAPGGTFAFMFMQTGTFAYHCAIHPFMQATITVIP